MGAVVLASLLAARKHPVAAESSNAGPPPSTNVMLASGSHVAALWRLSSPCLRCHARRLRETSSAPSGLRAATPRPWPPPLLPSSSCWRDPERHHVSTIATRSWPPPLLPRHPTPTSTSAHCVARSAAARRCGSPSRTAALLPDKLDDVEAERSCSRPHCLHSCTDAVMRDA
jgi:hypothetical protein